MANIQIINQFPKASFSRVDVEAERQLRLAIQGVISSEITDDGDHWTLTTLFPQAQAAVAPGAGPAPVPPVATVSSHVIASANPVFGSLVPGGFFSATPDDLSMPRSIRTNNPGALNFSAWQATRFGFVGNTQPDGSANHNVTTIYRTPEHGVASWFHLLGVIYNFAATGTFSLSSLAQHYAGVASGPAVNAYMTSWVALSGGHFTNATVIDITADNDLLALANAMFHHEAGKPTPIKPEQILFAIRHERAGDLPA